MRKITLIRHAETRANAEGRFSGKTEADVIMDTDEIYKIISAKISAEEMGEIYSSPSRRAIETAFPFSKNPVICDDVREIDFGKFENLTLKEIEDAFPDEYEKWIHSNGIYTFPEGDSIEGFLDRVVKGFKGIIDNSNSENITIFTHGGVIKCLISNMLVKDSSLYWNFKVDNCSVTQFIIEDEYVRFEKINF